MAKKKGSTNKLDEILNKIKTQNSFASLNDKEIAILQADLLIEGQREKVFNTLYYSYEKPEYEIMSPAARNWLLPFWNVEPYYTTIDEVLNKKSKTIRYNVKKNKKTILWSHVITFQKSGKYGPNNEHQIALIDARGTYPLKSTKNMAEYVARLEDGKIRQPNFSIVRKNIRQFEEDYKNPLTR